MRRWLLATVGGLAVVACVGALLLRFTPLLDGAADHITSTAGYPELAKRFHRGSRPCLRYPTVVAESKDIDDLAEALVAADVPTERLAELVYVYLDLIEKDETAAHELSAAEEHAQMIVEAAPPMQRPLVLLKRERWRKRIETLLVTAVAGRSRGAPLSAAEHAALDPVWRDHPEVLTVGSMVNVLRRMQVRLTAKRLDALAAFVGDGSMRDGFDERRVPAAMMTDGFGQPIRVEVSGDRVTFTSLGADWRERGLGDDADQVRVVELRTGEIATPSPNDEPAVASGAPPPKSVTLPRAEVDAALEHLELLSGQARMVPAFVAGKPVGFKIFVIHKGSLYERVGLENGDVVTAIDGFDLSTPEKALEVYSHLRGATAATLSLTRAGKPYAIRIDVRP